MEKRKQASRTPNASRNTTARSMSERQGVRGLLNLAAAFGVREACFRFGLSDASMRFGIGRTAKVKSCFCFRFNANGPGGAPFRPAQKLRCSPLSIFVLIGLAVANVTQDYAGLVKSPMAARFFPVPLLRVFGQAMS